MTYLRVDWNPGTSCVRQQCAAPQISGDHRYVSGPINHLVYTAKRQFLETVYWSALQYVKSVVFGTVNW